MPAGEAVVSEALRQWIHEVTGIAITRQNQAPVELAVRIHSERLDLHPQEFVGKVLSGLLPPQSFIDEITTNESYFFRAIDQMQTVVQQLVPAQLKRRPGRPVRLLSIPCARGEEPFSIAILLREFNIPDSAVELVGLDISQTCLDDARAGRYGALALRRTDPERAARWFRQRPSRGGGRQVILDPAIVSRVRLVRGNLLSDAPALLQPPFDIVFCENLLIYFDEPTAARALAVLNRLLAPDGWLFVDHAEWNLPRERFRMQTLHGCVGFRPINETGAMAAPQRPPAIEPARPPAPRWQSAAPPTLATSRSARPTRAANGHSASRGLGTSRSASRPTSRPTSRPASDVESTGLHHLLTAAAAHYQAKRFSDALLGYEQALALAPNDPTARLGKTRVLADCGEDFEALEQAEALLKGVDQGRIAAGRAQHVEALGLIALLLKKKGLAELAKDYLQKLARLDPAHPMLRLLDDNHHGR